MDGPAPYWRVRGVGFILVGLILAPFYMASEHGVYFMPIPGAVLLLGAILYGLNPPTRVPPGRYSAVEIREVPTPHVPAAVKLGLLIANAGPGSNEIGPRWSLLLQGDREVVLIAHETDRARVRIEADRWSRKLKVPVLTTPSPAP